MRIVQSFLPLVTFVAVACSAAPVQPREYLSLITARDVGEFEGREFSAPVFETREESEELEAREDDPLWLFARSGHGWPGPGMQHKHEHSGVPTSGFHPVPAKTYYKTANNVYSGHDVNKYAGNMVASIPHADPWNRKQNSRLKSYPKPGTGFRNSEPDNPAPNSSGKVSYHAPIPPARSPRRANTAPTRPGGSYKVGTDRIHGHRQPHDPNLTVGVSYHDPKKPIPPPASGGTPSRNHPFSVAHPQQGGAVKRTGAKLKQTAKKVVKGLKLTKKH